ncbi:hypothetical protein [Jiulongibacter sediminis]|uniref:hypothetical protein n=1 Tax=Jiulongibacter sediminis TaxID=1605367 RepID=UPI0026EA2005|nr:hypothetical protein [Jiulongibacter sediminis]
MNSSQKKGIGFIVGGVASFLILPRILYMIGLYFIPSFVFIIIALILIGLGIKILVDKNQNNNEINDYSKNDQSLAETTTIQQPNLPNTNKVVNVTLTGGIIGLIGDSPQNSLNRRIKKENSNGWKVIQIIPSASGNILLIILRLLILVCTLFFYTTSNGYYVIMEKKEE